MRRSVNIGLWLLLAFPVCGFAQTAPWDGGDLTVRFAKDTDSKNTDKPAVFSYQRNDGGKSDYITQGAVSLDKDFGTDNSWTVSPDVSWNHNTLATAPTNAWNVGANLVKRYVYDDRLDRLDFDFSAKWQRDLIKDSNSTPLRLDVTWYTKYLESTPWNPDSNWSLRPTVSAFWQDVRDAAVDKTTGVAPTGTVSGEIVTLNGRARMNRFSIIASVQNEHLAHAAAGQPGGAHRLSSIGLNYDFYDQPKTKQEQQALKWKAGVSLTRQEGDDPLNAIAKAGFTLFALTIKY